MELCLERRYDKGYRVTLRIYEGILTLGQSRLLLLRALPEKLQQAIYVESEKHATDEVEPKKQDKWWKFRWK